MHAAAGEAFQGFPCLDKPSVGLRATCDAEEELQLADSGKALLGASIELKMEVAQLSRRSACTTRAWLYQFRKKQPYGVSHEPSQLQKNPVSCHKRWDVRPPLTI